METPAHSQTLELVWLLYQLEHLDDPDGCIMRTLLETCRELVVKHGGHVAPEAIKRD
jgi:hypothetical protein